MNIQAEFHRRDELDRKHGSGTFYRQVCAELAKVKVIPIHELTDDAEIIRQRQWIKTRKPWYLYESLTNQQTLEGV